MVVSTRAPILARVAFETSAPLVGLPTAQREPRQARKGATVAESECGRPFFFCEPRRAMSVSTPPSSGLFLARTTFVLSAAAVALGLRSVAHKPLASLLIVALLVAVAVPGYLSR